jgi:probable rRNA maturation factor
MSDALEVDIIVNLGDFPDADAAELERAVRHTLASQGVGAAEISLTLLDDAEIRALNKSFLGHDRPTDVLAFSLGPGPALLGDVYVGAEQARRQAAELGISLAEELVRLAVHGTLHVAGHDHPEGEERERSPMFGLQETLVREIRSVPR